MTASPEPAKPILGIWFLAFGYFAAYTPYSALTKALSKGLLPSMDAPLKGFALLPASVLASLVGMIAFLTAIRWWRFATHRQVFGLSLPSPTRWTLLSGLCTAAIIMTTTLAYTFQGVSIVFMMLLMRGGVLVLAPIVDTLSRRKVRWFSWLGLALSLSALVVAFAERGGYDITLVCALDVAVYLGGYFVRLRFMSRLAKSDDPNANKRYFVEEQMVATPAALLALAIVALAGDGALSEQVLYGFTDFWSGPVVLPALIVGVLSQFTGIFGGLILLDRRENSFCVPVNRSSSIMAGILAAYGLTLFLDQPPPSTFQLIGAMLIIGAIVALTIPPQLEKRRLRVAARVAANPT